MKSAKYVADLIAKEKENGEDFQKIAWDAATACVGWAYVFGARGEYCDPSNRRSRARSDHPTIQSKCKNFNGADTKPGGCVGCQWFLGDSTYDKADPHKGRTRFFDCRGFTSKILEWVYGRKLEGAGATSQWNCAANWKEKGTIDTIPKDKLVCVFYTQKGNPKVMEHTGLALGGETIECGTGVTHSKTINKKWTHWALPACVEGSYELPESEPASTGKPTLTYPTIRQGAKGEVVVQLQSFLAQDGSQLAVDGIFGSGTASAVRAFQKRHGLDVDGIVGPKTWAKLLEVAGNIKIPSEEPGQTGTDEKLHTLIVPDLTEEQALELTKKYPKAVPVEYENVKPYLS